MAARKFKELSEPIKADPVRAKHIARQLSEAIAEIVEYTLGEPRRARKITRGHRTHADLATADDRSGVG